MINNMQENLTQEELNQIEDIQQRIQNIVWSLGQIELMKINLDKQHHHQKMLLDEVQIMEQDLQTQLSEKYPHLYTPAE
jgi:hypothetical protein